MPLTGTPGSVVTLGFGPGGSAGLVVTLGFGVGASASTRTRKETTIFRDIRARIESTGLFRSVLIGPPEALRQPVSDDGHVAFIEPVKFSEPASPAAFRTLRRTSWRLTIWLRASWEQDSEYVDGLDELEDLLLAAQDAVVGKALAGVTIPGLTTLGGDGDWPTDPHPNRTIRAGGEFAYVVNPDFDLI